MKITREEAVRESIKMWRHLAETGSCDKAGYEGFYDAVGEWGMPENDCWLCKFTFATCSLCSLPKKGVRYASLRCYPLGYQEWRDSKSTETRKAAAQKCLDVLLGLEAK